MKYYHATDLNNLTSIAKEGLLRGCDGCVYLTENPDEAMRFLLLRLTQYIAVLEITIPKSSADKIVESFDHNENFFKCKAYAYTDDISSDWCKLYNVYENKFGVTINDECK